MKAMILAAGRGERLRPLTDRMPKPMIPIASEPLITHQIRWLRRAGVTEVVINLHHLGDQIQSHLGSGRDLGVSIRYSLEEELLDTGGGIVKALPLLGEAPFLLLNGDIWSNFRFVGLVDAVPETGHVVLTPSPAHLIVSDFVLDGTRVTHNANDNLVYCGIAVLNPALFDGAVRPRFSLRDLLFAAAADGRLSGERFDGTWIDIGSQEQLKAVRRLYL